MSAATSTTAGQHFLQSTLNRCSSSLASYYLTYYSHVSLPPSRPSSTCTFLPATSIATPTCCCSTLTSDNKKLLLHDNKKRKVHLYSPRNPTQQRNLQAIITTGFRTRNIETATVGRPWYHRECIKRKKGTRWAHQNVPITTVVARHQEQRR